MNKFQAIIFDLDGTLIDTLGDIAQSVNQALKKHDLPTHPVDSYRYIVGNGAQMTISRSLSEDKQHLVDVILQQQRAFYAEHCFDYTQPYPGITCLLEVLQDSRFKLAILSNKSQPFVNKLVNHFFAANTFDIVRGQQPDVPLKPDPTAARDIAARFNIACDQVIYLGDTAVDMQTARQAGMFAVGATWGFRDRAELEQNGCHALIDHPSQLLDFIRE